MVYGEEDYVGNVCKPANPSRNRMQFKIRPIAGYLNFSYCGTRVLHKLAPKEAFLIRCGTIMALLYLYPSGGLVLQLPKCGVEESLYGIVCTS